MKRKLSQLYYTRICSTRPPPQGRRHSRRVTNPATAESNMSGCMQDTSLRIAPFSSDRLDGPDRYTKNRWNAGIVTITNRSVSNSECEPVCDLKTVAEVSKNGDVTRQPASGRPRVTTPCQDRYVVISA
ncbi:hypothetical protein TNCV_2642751 [Trichonephila clavipes]|nr:hypothetical protein TNCV_2642751 [Trichonephila clavipes]